MKCFTVSNMPDASKIFNSHCVDDRLDSKSSVRRTLFLRFLTTSVLSAFALLTIFFVAGVPMQLAAQAATLLVLNALPFAFIWAILRSRHSASKPSFIEILAVGTIISIAFQLLANIAWTSIGFGQIQWLFVFALELLLALFVAIRMRNHSLEIQPSGSVLTAVAISLPLFMISRIIDFYQAPTLDQVPFDRIHPDLYLFEAMGNAISRFGPGESGLQLGQSVRYHWFAYAWSSWFSDQLDAGPLIVLARITPMLGAVLLAVLVGVLASFYFRNFWIPSIAALALLVPTNFDHYTGDAVSLGSGSHSLGAVWLLGILLISTNFWPENNWWVSTPVVLLFSAAAMGSKVSHGIIIVAGVGILFLARFLMYRRFPKRYFILFLTTLIPITVVYFLYESGQPSAGALGTSINLFNIRDWNDTYGLFVATAVTILARGLRWIGLGYAVMNKKTRSWNITWLALGAAMISMAAAPILRSENGTEQWFLESAGIWVIPAVTLTSLHFIRGIKLAQSNHFRRIVVSILLAGVFTGLIFQILLESAINITWPFLSVAITCISAFAFATMISLRWFRVRHLGKNWLGVIGSVALIAAFIFSIIAPLQKIQASALSEPRPVLYYPWAKDFIMESEDPQLKSAAVSAAAWLQENANTNDVLVVSFPTQAWLGALSGLRLYNSFPEQLAAWSQIDEDVKTKWPSNTTPSSDACDLSTVWQLSLDSTIGGDKIVVTNLCLSRSIDFTSMTRM
jgi:hypothetical protein